MMPVAEETITRSSLSQSRPSGMRHSANPVCSANRVWLEHTSTLRPSGAVATSGSALSVCSRPSAVCSTSGSELPVW